MSKNFVLNLDHNENEMVIKGTVDDMTVIENIPGFAIHITFPEETINYVKNMFKAAGYNVSDVIIAPESHVTNNTAVIEIVAAAGGE